MALIESLYALEILDSRGNPTIKVTLITENGIVATAKVPSGASKGEHEAVELRDHDESRYFGKGVTKAVNHVNTTLFQLLKNKSVLEQEKRDQEMIMADGTENKSHLGANAILGVSLAIARAAAMESSLPLYRYLSQLTRDHPFYLPCPMMNILNGGIHADNNLDIQEFMIRPIGAPSFSEALRWGCEVFQTLKKILKNKGLSTSVGDEGGFAPNLSSHEEALDLLLTAIEQAGYKPKKEISIALDVAASEFFDSETSSYIQKKKKQASKPFLSRTSKEQVDYILSLCRNYPIDSVEDPLDQNDWEGWKLLTKEATDHQFQIVGDDIFVTNPKILKRGIQEKAANAILIKLNQIGTLTETIETIQLAQDNQYRTIVSHRSGETEDSFIADFAVAMATKQIKTGGLCRSERIAKYNRLLQIEDELGSTGKYLPF